MQLCLCALFCLAALALAGCRTPTKQAKGDLDPPAEQTSPSTEEGEAQVAQREAGARRPRARARWCPRGATPPRPAPPSRAGRPTSPHGATGVSLTHSTLSEFPSREESSVTVTVPDSRRCPQVVVS